jgi:hypothetical protein
MKCKKLQNPHLRFLSDLCIYKQMVKNAQKCHVRTVMLTACRKNNRVLRSLGHRNRLAFGFDEGSVLPLSLHPTPSPRHHLSSRVVAVAGSVAGSGGGIGTATTTASRPRWHRHRADDAVEARTDVPLRRSFGLLPAGGGGGGGGGSGRPPEK